MSAESIVPDSPPVTRHAAQRWSERTERASVAPGTAWLHATRIDAGGPLRNVDVRHHQSTGTLLLSETSWITTVYTVDELTDAQYHAVKHALPENHE